MSMNRLIVAFLIAPPAIPSIAFRLWEMRPLSVPDLAAIFLNSVVTYAGIFLFGIPAYLFLRARKWTTFWAAAIAGFIVAGLTCWLLGIVTSFLGGWDLLDVHVHLAWLRFALWPCGPLGALVATLLWIVTRPDRAGKPPRIMRMARPIIAFLVAPLAVPLFVAVDMYPLLATPFFVRVVLYLSILTAYVGTFVFGIPAYLLLRARKWTAFWLAPVLGFMGGALAWWLFLAVPWTGSSFRFEPVWDLSRLRDVLWPYGPLGALVGTLLWLIARPDRAERRDVVPGEQREPTPPNA
jgi:hypothetical protein